MRYRIMPVNMCCPFIDPDPRHQVLFTRALTDVSPDAICFIETNGNDALHSMITEGFVPDYIFAEFQMKDDLNAIEFLRALKKIEILKEIPVIVHSISPQPQQIIELKESGALAIYYRPYEYFGVCNMLELYFGSQMASTPPN